jgi:hypothetical protein
MIFSCFNPIEHFSTVYQRIFNFWTDNLFYQLEVASFGTIKLGSFGANHRIEYRPMRLTEAIQKLQSKQDNFQFGNLSKVEAKEFMALVSKIQKKIANNPGEVNGRLIGQELDRLAYLFGKSDYFHELVFLFLARCCLVIGNLSALHKLCLETMKVGKGRGNNLVAVYFVLADFHQKQTSADFASLTSSLKALIKNEPTLFDHVYDYFARNHELTRRFIEEYMGDVYGKMDESLDKNNNLSIVNRLLTEKVGKLH